MITKCNIARKVAEEGVEVIIANGKRADVLTELVLHPDSDPLCTRFVPNDTLASSMKRWIAHSSGFVKGRIVLKDDAVNAVCGECAESVLAVGVTDVIGDFEKDDLVAVVDSAGKEIGVGRIAYDSDEARQAMGQHGLRPFIHYDYLCLVL